MIPNFHTHIKFFYGSLLIRHSCGVLPLKFSNELELLKLSRIYLNDSVKGNLTQYTLPSK